MEDFSHRLHSDLMLSKQKWQKHQHASIMDDPPHIYVALGEAFAIRWVTGDVLRNQQCHTGNRSLSNYLCRGQKEIHYLKLSFLFCFLFGFSALESCNSDYVLNLCLGFISNFSSQIVTQMFTIIPTHWLLFVFLVFIHCPCLSHYLMWKLVHLSGFINSPSFESLSYLSAFQFVYVSSASLGLSFICKCCFWSNASQMDWKTFDMNFGLSIIVYNITKHICFSCSSISHPDN